jgi:hypothetical protein
MGIPAAWFRVILLTAAFACLTGPPAEACSCSQGGRCGHFADAAAVFVGDVLDIGPPIGDVRFTKFRVIAVAKGTPKIGDVVTLSSGLGGGDCGLSFARGERWAIYAGQRAGGVLQTHMCSGSRPVEGNRTAPDLRVRPGEVTGGFVRYTRRGPLDGFPQAGARVWIELPGGKAETRTDARGRYRFEQVPTGRWVVHFKARSGASASGIAVLPSRDDCGEAYGLLGLENALR